MLQAALESWRSTCGAVLSDVSRKQRNGPTPQAEIDYWAERSTTLTALADQLESKPVQVRTRSVWMCSKQQSPPPFRTRSKCCSSFGRSSWRTLSIV